MQEMAFHMTPDFKFFSGVLLLETTPHSLEGFCSLGAQMSRHKFNINHAVALLYRPLQTCKWPMRTVPYKDWIVRPVL